MTDDHDAAIADVVTHGVQIGRVRGDVDAVLIDGRSTPSMTAIMEVRDVADASDVVP